MHKDGELYAIAAAFPLAQEGPLAIVPGYAVSLTAIWIRHAILHIDIMQLLPARQLDIVHLRDARVPGMAHLCGPHRILTELHKCACAGSKSELPLDTKVPPKGSQPTVTDYLLPPAFRRPGESTAMKASCGMRTSPTWRAARFFPAFCFSISFFLRETSPP